MDEFKELLEKFRIASARAAVSNSGLCFDPMAAIDVKRRNEIEDKLIEMFKKAQSGD